MWRLVREGLRIYRPVLLNAWLIGTLAGVVVPAVLALADVISPRAAVSWRQGAWPTYIVLASAIAGWIVLGNEMTEHRLRLHLMLPLPHRQVELAHLLLPTVMMFLGLPVAHFVSIVSAVVAGRPVRWQSHVWIALVAVHLLLLVQQSFAIREIAGAREDGGWKALSASIFPVFVLLAQFWGFVRLEDNGLEVAMVLTMTGLLMAHTLMLFSRRSQFAR